MKILVDIGHPAHVHFFKYFIYEMKRRGHEFIITTRNKDVSVQLLRAYDIEHEIVGEAANGIISLFVEWLGRDLKIYRIAKQFKPDILVGINNPSIAHVAKLIVAKSIIFTDTEHAKLSNFVTFPFSDVVCTPFCFKKTLGRKQLRYNGYQELAYLHPNYFKPDPSVLANLDLNQEDIYVIVRFVSWGASHDIGQGGFNAEGKKRLVEELNRYAYVLITSENSLPEELEKYRLRIAPEKMHDLLYYAKLYVGEGATMATEAAILGTPSIFVSSLSNKLGNFVELESKYGLVHSYQKQDSGIEKAVKLLSQVNSKEEWAKKRRSLLNDKIDVTQFMVNLVSNYSHRNSKNIDYEIRGR